MLFAVLLTLKCIATAMPRRVRVKPDLQSLKPALRNPGAPLEYPLFAPNDRAVSSTIFIFYDLFYIWLNSLAEFQSHPTSPSSR
jgi:hypothetical protein